MFKLTLLFFVLCLFSNRIIAQDSIPEKEDVTEDVVLQFQEFFFKALSQKSIGNHQKAIENLENCNQLIANDIAVFFEFSKNFLAINRTSMAKEYITRALTKDENNVWMLKHLVKIYQRERDFEKAIEVQKKVVAQNPKEREFLVRLYLYNKQTKDAMNLINVLDNESRLSSYLKKIRKDLERREKKIATPKKTNDITGLLKQFNNKKSYNVLKQILELSTDNSTRLLKYSEEGIALFPAQPYLYLIRAKALNKQKQYQKAISTLQNGIDFVIEVKMEANFYKEIAKAHKGLGNVKEEQKYQQKAAKIKS